jgi:hypothetical protein
LDKAEVMFSGLAPEGRENLQRFNIFHDSEYEIQNSTKFIQEKSFREEINYV